VLHPGTGTGGARRIWWPYQLLVWRQTAPGSRRRRCNRSGDRCALGHL